MTVSVGENVSTPNELGGLLTDLDEGVAKEEIDPPGFEAVFAIWGLFAVAYLVQRKKED